MKNSYGWKQLVETIGIVILIVSLLFVAYQLQQDRRIAVAQIIAESDGAIYELMATISENQDVWQRGLKGEKLSDIEATAFKAVAIAIYQRNLGRYGIRRQLGVDGLDHIAQQYAFDLFQYPSLREIFVTEGKLIASRDDFFGRPEPRGFRALVTQHLEKLDDASTEFPVKTYFPY